MFAHCFRRCCRRLDTLQRRRPFPKRPHPKLARHVVAAKRSQLPSIDQGTVARWARLAGIAFQSVGRCCCCHCKNSVFIIGKRHQSTPSTPLLFNALRMSARCHGNTWCGRKAGRSASSHDANGGLSETTKQRPWFISRWPVDVHGWHSYTHVHASLAIQPVRVAQARVSSSPPSYRGAASFVRCT